jgi:hypothetical protein
MTDELRPEELEAEAVEELPAREAMSTVPIGDVFDPGQALLQHDEVKNDPPVYETPVEPPAT